VLRILHHWQYGSSDKADMSVTGKVKSCVVENLPAGLSIGCPPFRFATFLLVSFTPELRNVLVGEP
jgi:hypothetical protein